MPTNTYSLVPLTFNILFNALTTKGTKNSQEIFPANKFFIIITGYWFYVLFCFLAQIKQTVNQQVILVT